MSEQPQPTVPNGISPQTIILSIVAVVGVLIVMGLIFTVAAPDDPTREVLTPVSASELTLMFSQLRGQQATNEAELNELRTRVFSPDLNAADRATTEARFTQVAVANEALNNNFGTSIATVATQLAVQGTDVSDIQGTLIGMENTQVAQSRYNATIEFLALNAFYATQTATAAAAHICYVAAVKGEAAVRNGPGVEYTAIGSIKLGESAHATYRNLRLSDAGSLWWYVVDFTPYRGYEGLAGGWVSMVAVEIDDLYLDWCEDLEVKDR